MTLLLDLGPQPLSNRFLREKSESELRFPIRLGQCGQCGVIQLLSAPPPEELRPRFGWITYNEPEPHLDNLAEQLVKIGALEPSAKVLGTSYKDDSLLRRLRERGFPNTHRLDVSLDLGVADPHAGVETVAAVLDVEAARRIAQRRGRAKIIIARHIFEHAPDPRGLMAALAELLDPEGVLVLEAPDCTRGLDTHDAATVWEEHTLYLTPTTFRHAVSHAGFQAERFLSYPYALEDSMVVIARPGGRPMAPTEKELRQETARGAAFAGAHSGRRARVREALAATRGTGKVVMLGANHGAVAFLEMYGVADLVDAIVDDNPNKQGLLMPGSQLPIRNSNMMMEGRVKLCLLAVNPAVEENVIAKHAPFRAAGGRFASIFPASPHALVQ